MGTDLMLTVLAVESYMEVDWDKTATKMFLLRTTSQSEKVFEFEE